MAHGGKRSSGKVRPSEAGPLAETKAALEALDLAQAPPQRWNMISNNDDYICAYTHMQTHILIPT